MHRILSLALLTSALAWAEPGSVSRGTDLKEKPFLDAATVGRLAADSPLDIQLRQGAWAKVRAQNGQEGWLKVLNLRSAASSTSSGRGGLGQLVNVARSGSSGNTVTTGVKGLSAEQIRNARPNEKEVQRLSGYAVSAQDAARFARTSQLQPQKVTAIGSAQRTDEASSSSD